MYAAFSQTAFVDAAFSQMAFNHVAFLTVANMQGNPKNQRSYILTVLIRTNGISIESENQL